MSHINVKLEEEELWYIIGGLHKYIQHCGEAIKKSPLDQDEQIEQVIDTIQNLQHLKERFVEERLQLMANDQVFEA